MQLDIFCEMQKPRPWRANHEYELIQETLEQARLADELGYGCWWEVEHHTAEEFSFSSAPEVMLATIAQHTRRMRIGHAVVLAPQNFNHPIRIAERSAFLDLVSGGRLEMGFGRSTPREWRIFGVDPDETREQLQEALLAVPKMWTLPRFSWSGKWFSTPGEVPVVPHPLQKPHPPMWMAATSAPSFEMAGRNGIGVLAVTLATPIEVMAGLLDIYREAIKDPQPAGDFVNEQAAVFTFVHCAETTAKAIAHGAPEAVAWYVNFVSDFFEAREARRRMAERAAAQAGGDAGGGLTGQYSTPAAPAVDPETAALLARIANGEHVSGEEAFEVFNKHDSIIVGDPETCLRKMERYRGIGVDRLMCFQQTGRLAHEHVMESIRLVGERLVPHFRNGRA